MFEYLYPNHYDKQNFRNRPTPNSIAVPVDVDKLVRRSKRVWRENRAAEIAEEIGFLGWEIPLKAAKEARYGKTGASVRSPFQKTLMASLLQASLDGKGNDVNPSNPVALAGVRALGGGIDPLVAGGKGGPLGSPSLALAKGNASMSALGKSVGKGSVWQSGKGSVMQSVNPKATAARTGKGQGKVPSNVLSKYNIDQWGKGSVAPPAATGRFATAAQSKAGSMAPPAATSRFATAAQSKAGSMAPPAATGRFATAAQSKAAGTMGPAATNTTATNTGTMGASYNRFATAGGMTDPMATRAGAKDTMVGATYGGDTATVGGMTNTMAGTMVPAATGRFATAGDTMAGTMGPAATGRYSTAAGTTMGMDTGRYATTGSTYFRNSGTSGWG